MKIFDLNLILVKSFNLNYEKQKKILNKKLSNLKNLIN